MARFAFMSFALFSMTVCGLLTTLLGSLPSSTGFEPTPTMSSDIGQTVYLGCDALPALIVPDEVYGDTTLYVLCGGINTNPAQSAIAFVPSVFPDGAVQQVGVNSPSNYWQAVVVLVDGEERLFVFPTPGGEIYEVAGIPLPYRPISNLAWLDDDLLAFDRWSQPHFGWRYIVDIRAQELTFTAPIADALYIRDQFPPEVIGNAPRVMHGS